MARHMYHIDGITDLAVIRKQAMKTSQSDGYREGIPVVIHLHKYGESCGTHEEDQEKHEHYPPLASEVETLQERAETTGEV